MIMRKTLYLLRLICWIRLMNDRFTMKIKEGNVMAKKILILCIVLLLPYCVFAQKDLNIANVFNEYGKRKGSVMIELSKDILRKNTNIDHYKSLQAKGDVSMLRMAQKDISRDVTGGIRLKEEIKNGMLVTGYYCLKKNVHNSIYEYILYKSNCVSEMSLIYLKGDFSPQNLENELSRLKDLFIYVNKKRIKLQ